MRKPDRQKRIEALFPTGLSEAQFKQLCLESAGPDGIIHPPWVDPFIEFSLLTGMLVIDGHVERVNHGYHTPFLPLRITDQGRAALTQMQPLLRHEEASDG